MRSRDDLLAIGKKVFNYHPGESFDSIRQLLDSAKRDMRNRKYYEQGAALFAEYLAQELDERSEE